MNVNQVQTPVSHYVDTASNHANAKISGSLSKAAEADTPQAKTTSPEAVAQQEALPPEAVDQTVAAINKQLQTLSTEINFSVDKDAGETVLKVVDTQSGELIRQIPNEESLRILSNARKNLDTTMSLMVDQHA